ncbi:hypothetical protein ACFV2N_40940 [Streptomyces sp. NPDC059680]|uniref:hypothetical protein n=1 Tax=Streptomyces TaxID=1883 RepID=UPI001E5C4774|nr:hypothetical protein [Streptomyces barringtoniae]MCC5480959.1 hypothetical protein [Streptomyces barringtoniae]
MTSDPTLLRQMDNLVVLMLENRSFDNMLGFLYTDQDNRSPSGQSFEGLTGAESNPDGNGGRVAGSSARRGRSRWMTLHTVAGEMPNSGASCRMVRFVR